MDISLGSFKLLFVLAIILPFALSFAAWGVANEWRSRSRVAVCTLVYLALVFFIADAGMLVSVGSNITYYGVEGAMNAFALYFTGKALLVYLACALGGWIGSWAYQRIFGDDDDYLPLISFACILGPISGSAVLSVLSI